MTVRPHADDLGLHASIDRAIFRAFEAGAIAGASVLATGPTFRQAASQARTLGLPLAAHLALVDTGPLSPPAEVPSLVDRDGRFPAMFGTVVRRSLLERLKRSELRRELRRQLQTFAEADLTPPGGLVVDGHQHLHLLPPVFAVLLEMASEFRIRAFRLPQRSPRERRERSLRSLTFGLAEWLGSRVSDAGSARGIAAVPCWGVLYAGHLTPRRARDVLDSLPSDAEGQLLCHPGDDNRALAALRPWGYDWETELASALSLAPTAPR
jgi:predicted glycoside hydrolase/deacetylase ChbG (UPF0249 family)